MHCAAGRRVGVSLVIRHPCPIVRIVRIVKSASSRSRSELHALQRSVRCAWCVAAPIAGRQRIRTQRAHGCEYQRHAGMRPSGARLSDQDADVCDFVAGPLPAHHRGTRRKYVHVGSYAASMPRKVPRRWAGKDPSRWLAGMVFSKATDRLPGAVALPLAGPCGGMDAATEPPRTDSRRVPRAARAPRPLLTASNDATTRHPGAAACVRRRIARCWQPRYAIRNPANNPA
ncbi:hypothetical protein FHT08_000390 [Xanthomonas campestris]|nr:hypothetical protein [Xanthomonas sp. CFBP 8151]